MEYYALIGCGGFGREVMPLIRKMLSPLKNYKVVFIVEGKKSIKQVNGIDLMNPEDYFSLDGKKFFNVAIADSKVRERISEEFIDRGALPFSIHDNNIIVFDNNQIGEGAILCPYVTITSNIKIGKFFHGNIYSYVAHDCVIGDYVTFAPRVSCNGGVIIENHAYIGTGAVIKQMTPDKPIIIGEGAIVGMGSIVTKSVEPYTTVVGNPAKPFGK